jgi:hypothetical protein
MAEQPDDAAMYGRSGAGAPRVPIANALVMPAMRSSGVM